RAGDDAAAACAELDLSHRGDAASPAERREPARVRERQVDEPEVGAQALDARGPAHEARQLVEGVLEQRLEREEALRSGPGRAGPRRAGPGLGADDGCAQGLAAEGLQAPGEVGVLGCGGRA